MKKLTKLLSLLLVFIMAFSSVSMAAEIVEDSTTVQDGVESVDLEEIPETETPEDEPAVPEETPVVPEDPATPEETPVVPDDEPAIPEEEPKVPGEEPETPEEEPAEKPEVVLPPAPTYLNGHVWFDTDLSFTWSRVDEATGYAFYMKENGEWVLKDEPKDSGYTYTVALYNSKYEFAVKSYVEVDGVKYYSENQVECTVQTYDTIPLVNVEAESVKEGMRIRWENQPGISGHRVYIYENNKWKKIESVAINGEATQEYIYKDVKAGESYRFGLMPYAKGTEGTVFGSRSESFRVTHKDFTKAEIKSKSAKSSSVTLKWSAVDGASGYRVYVYKDGKWKYYTGIKTETYTVKDLKDATKYNFKIRAYFKADGKTTWGTYSDVVSVTTKGKTVKASRISKLKKYFTDGDWSVKISGLNDEIYGKLDCTFAVKGDKVFARYDYKNKNIEDFECLIDTKTETVSIIFDYNKTYVVLKEEEAESMAYSIFAMCAVLDLSSAKGVTAKTTTYSGKRAVAEIYTDKDLGIKKTFYFINDTVKALKLTYADGSTETVKISKINDTPSLSVFKIPSGYKRAFF